VSPSSENPRKRGYTFPAFRIPKMMDTEISQTKTGNRDEIIIDLIQQPSQAGLLVAIS
jgi:hypothetical protein